MKRAIRMGAVLAAAAVLLTGCGEKMTELTESEEDVVVNYSAGTLAKHNSFQQEGVTAVYPEEEEPQQEETEEQKEPKQPEEQSKESENEKKEDTSEQPETTGQLTLTEALQVSGIEFSYKDYSITGSYKQGDYFSLDASAGKTFLILNMNITNTGSEKTECDLLTKQPIFTLKLNGETGIKNEVTILANDLSTYVGSLEPGETQAAILLFEVPEKTAENISSMQVSLQMNDKISEIKLK